ncbi:MAG TPA: amino acid permease [Vicinamibacterales bacterium]|jgi:arginine:agmatine antiporter
MMGGESKKIGPFLAIMLVASTMIGSGVFLLPASLAAVGSISILAWVAATIGAGILAGVFSWLAVLNPGTPGLFSYIRDAFGAATGFVAAVLYAVSTLVACVAIALAVTGYLGVFVPTIAKPPGLTIGTVAILWILIAANIAGPRFVARLQSWTMALGLAPVVLVALGGWFYFHGATFAASWNVTGEAPLAVLPGATVMVFWAFLGIETAIVLSTRVRNPARDVPIGTIGGLAVAAMIYMAACSAIMGILPGDVLAKSSAPFADAVVPMLGASVAGLVALSAMLKASGTLGSTVLLTAETAESDSVLRQISPAGPRHADKVTRMTLIAIGGLGSLVAIASTSPTLVRQFTIVTNIAVVLNLVVYGAGSLALVRLSGRLPRRSRIRAQGLGAAGTVFSAALIAASEADLLIWSAVATLAAVLAYWAANARRAQHLARVRGA